nr:enoyl-CoA hydratase-related protein [Hydrocarboniphaga sp.]
MSYRALTYEISDGIATLTLSRPDRLNAFTVPMMLELLDVFDRVDHDDAVRALVVTGAGRAFCAGADISTGIDGFLVEPGGGQLHHDEGGLAIQTQRFVMAAVA